MCYKWPFDIRRWYSGSLIGDWNTCYANWTIFVDNTCLVNKDECLHVECIETMPRPDCGLRTERRSRSSSVPGIRGGVSGWKPNKSNCLIQGTDSKKTSDRWFGEVHTYLYWPIRIPYGHCYLTLRIFIIWSPGLHCHQHPNAFICTTT